MGNTMNSRTTIQMYRVVEWREPVHSVKEVLKAAAPSDASVPRRHSPCWEPCREWESPLEEGYLLCPGTWPPTAWRTASGSPPRPPRRPASRSRWDSSGRALLVLAGDQDERAGSGVLGRTPSPSRWHIWAAAWPAPARPGRPPRAAPARRGGGPIAAPRGRPGGTPEPSPPRGSTSTATTTAARGGGGGAPGPRRRRRRARGSGGRGRTPLPSRSARALRTKVPESLCVTFASPTSA